VVDGNFKYTIGILNFVISEDEYSPECYHHEVKLMDTADKHVFFDKLTYIYLEVPKFNKKEDELETMFDKWMFVLRNLSNLMDRPAALQERVFTRLFDTAEIAKFTQQEMYDYQASLKEFRDYNNTIDSAKEESLAKGVEIGIEKGIEKGRFGLFLNMLKKGASIETLKELTDISEDEIDKLKEYLRNNPLQ